jgi:hypothetical protein
MNGIKDKLAKLKKKMYIEHDNNNMARIMSQIKGT